MLEFINNPNLKMFIPPSPDEITPRELSKKLQSGAQIILLDVREPYEYASCKINGALLIPLGELKHTYGRLDPSAEIIVYCKIGVRSAVAVQFLIQKGYKSVKNLAGGIIRWVDEFGRM